jgi:hypothetical protein
MSGFLNMSQSVTIIYFSYSYLSEETIAPTLKLTLVCFQKVALEYSRVEAGATSKFFSYHCQSRGGHRSCSQSHITLWLRPNNAAPCGSSFATLILMEPEAQHDGRSRGRIEIFTWSRSRFKMLRLRTTAN